jgi:CBS domain containing-hemolysin-like protein
MSVVAAVLLLLGNAFFVGAQFALITARADQIEPLAERGSRVARITLHQLRSLPQMLAGSQLGIAGCSLGLGAVAEPAFSRALESGFDGLQLPHSALHPTAFIVALAVVSYAHMVLGEMVPKNLALAGPVRAALLLGPPMAAWELLTRPILAVMNAMANVILRLGGITLRHQLGGSVTAEELADLFAESAAQGLLDKEEQQRLQAALRVDRMCAADLRLPLADLVTIAPQTTGRDLDHLVVRTGYSRFPVQRGNRLAGYVHVKDVLDLSEAELDRPLPARLHRPLVSVEHDAPLADAAAALRGTRAHLARVVQQDSTVGVLALDDLLRAVVGTANPAG